MRALVLSGGGAKGAYQVGVWKALRKLNIDIDIITGTSIGAVNGLFIMQNKYVVLKNLWTKKDISNYFGKEYKDLSAPKEAIKIYGNNIIERKGINTDEFTKLIKKSININKVYSSKIKYGLITMNLDSLKPTIITKDKTSKDELIDYAIASASAFPVLNIKKIKDKKYVDGGYYDNLPINLAIDMGADEVIAVDLEAVGLKRKIKNEDIPVTMIKPQIDLGDFIVFNKSLNKRNIRLGYNDTMKMYKKLEGNLYTFKLNELNKNYEKYYEDFSYIVKRELAVNNTRVINELNKIPMYKKAINNQDTKRLMNKSMELLGKIFELPIDQIYTAKLFNYMIKIKFNNYVDDKIINVNNIKKLKIDKVINKKQLIKNIIKFLEKPVEHYKELSELSILFPDEFLASLYLYTIS